MMTSMTQVLDRIPDQLQSEVEAALTWFNAREGGGFEVTGIVDPPEAAATGAALRLVLCGHGTCRQETFRVQGFGPNQQIEWLNQPEDAITQGVAELDPPPGPRRTWLDETSAKHDFTVLLFYRGFW